MSGTKTLYCDGCCEGCAFEGTQEKCSEAVNGKRKQEFTIPSTDEQLDRVFEALAKIPPPPKRPVEERRRQAESLIKHGKLLVAKGEEELQALLKEQAKSKRE
jgi:hypothetical protein